MLPQALATIAAIAAVTAISPGTARASGRKPGAKGKAGRPSGKKDAGKRSADASPAGTKGAASRPPVKTGKKSRLPEGWPAWRFPPMAPPLEDARRKAERNADATNFYESTFAWDGLRALALRVYGPDDPRPWAALSRAARNLLDSEKQTEATKASELTPSNVPELAELLRRTATISLDAARGLAGPPCQGGTGGRPASGDAMDQEIAFARETAKELDDWVARLGRPPHATFPGPFASASSVIYPGFEAAQRDLPWKSAEDFRLLLAREESPGGSGPGTVEALSLRSRLGGEIFDSGDPTREKEALDLLREASEGLDTLLGPGDTGALDAKIRLARCLAGLAGSGRLLETMDEVPPPERLRAAEALLREALSLAGGLPAPLRNSYALNTHLKLARVLCLLKGPRDGFNECLAASEGQHGMYPNTPPSASFFVFGECYRYSGLAKDALKSYSGALWQNRAELGWRHPKTAQALALAGDMALIEEGKGAAMPFWALALEALEDGGELFEMDRAGLEYRLGQELAESKRHEEALPILERALSRAAGALGESNWMPVKCLLLLCNTRFALGSLEAAEEGWRKSVRFLEGLRGLPRTRTGKEKHTDLLYLALMSLGGAISTRGDAEAAKDVWTKVIKIKLPATSKFAKNAKLLAANFFMSKPVVVKDIYRPDGGGPGGGGRKGR
jgi:tetratricopeptide (TPR) repeat protein